MIWHRCVGPFGETLRTTPVSDDVLLQALLGRRVHSRRAVNEYIDATIALLQTPPAVLHAALRRLLAPAGTLASLEAGPAARSRACWLRVKTVVAAKAFVDDDAIQRDGLARLADEEKVVPRAEWASVFGVQLGRHKGWRAEASDVPRLRERVEANGGRLDGLTLVEVLSLLAPDVARVWHTPLAFFAQAQCHHAEVRPRLCIER